MIRTKPGWSAQGPGPASELETESLSRKGSCRRLLSSHIGHRRDLQGRILWMRSDVAAIIGLAIKGQAGTARVIAISRNRHSGQIVMSVRKNESKAKGSVFAQLDRFAADGYFCIRFGGPINNQFRVHIEPERFLFLWAAGKTGDAGNGPEGRRRHSEFRNPER